MSISLCEEVYITAIPDEFRLTYEQIIGLQRLSPDEWWTEGYGSFLAGPELHEFLQPYFQKPIGVRYQVISRDRPYHIDACIQTFKYNFVYETGGNEVKTIWQTHRAGGQSPFVPFEITCKQNTWYKLNVKVSHCVKDIESARLSITIKEDL